jgi:hypothetical protein
MTDLIPLDPAYEGDAREKALLHMQSADKQGDARMLVHRVAEAQVYAILDLAAAYRERTALMSPPENPEREWTVDVPAEMAKGVDPADVASTIVAQLNDKRPRGGRQVFP